MIKYFKLAALALIVSSGLAGCRKTPDNDVHSGVMTMVCDKSFENVIEQEIDLYEFQNPKSSILCNYVDESVALDSLMSGNTRTAILARDLTEAEMKKLKKEHQATRSMQIAVDAVALIVDTANDVNDITVSDLADILTGRVTDWNQIEPSNAGKIRVFFDSPGSSLQSFLRNKIMNGQPFSDKGNLFITDSGSVAEVFKKVKQNKGAIGIVGVSWITTTLDTTDMSDSELESFVNEETTTAADFRTNTQIKVLGVRADDKPRAYKPFQQNIYDGTYPLTRPVYMITTAYSNSLAGGFFSFVTGSLGQKLILKTGLMPARVNLQVVELPEQ